MCGFSLRPCLHPLMLCIIIAHHSSFFSLLLTYPKIPTRAPALSTLCLPSCMSTGMSPSFNYSHSPCHFGEDLCRWLMPFGTGMGISSCTVLLVFALLVPRAGTLGWASDCLSAESIGANLSLFSVSVRFNKSSFDSGIRFLIVDC